MNLTEHVEGVGTELSGRGGKGVLVDLFPKITRLYLEGEKRKPLRDSQVDAVFLRILWAWRWLLDLKWILRSSTKSIEWIG